MDRIQQRTAINSAKTYLVIELVVFVSFTRVYFLRLLFSVRFISENLLCARRTAYIGPVEGCLLFCKNLWSYGLFLQLVYVFGDRI